MKTTPLILATAAIGLFSAVTVNASSDPGGMLKTMPQGLYECALPGDAAGDSIQPQPQESFRILPASGYSTDGGSGTYILRGKELTFTRGPKKGQRFRKTGSFELQKLSADGTPERLICTRAG